MPCFYCNERLTPRTKTIEHLIPVSQDGNSEVGNLVDACLRCNQFVADWGLEKKMRFLDLLRDSGGWAGLPKIGRKVNREKVQALLVPPAAKPVRLPAAKPVRLPSPAVIHPGTTYCWTIPPQVDQPHGGMAALIGTTAGQLTIVGYLKRKKNQAGAKMLAQCSCGLYCARRSISWRKTLLAGPESRRWQSAKCQRCSDQDHREWLLTQTAKVPPGVDPDGT